MKTWKPTTCDCTIEEIYDGNEIVGVGEIISKCAFHQGLEDNVALYAVMMKEGGMAMDTLRALQADESLTEEKFNQDGTTRRALKGEYVFAFTGEGDKRTMTYEIKGVNMSQAQKDRVNVKGVSHK